MMKYYYIRKLWIHSLGTSKLGISRSNQGLLYDAENFWNYPNKIRLDVYAEDQETKLYFKKYVQNSAYILLVIPELKLVLEQFNMPSHRWYKAEAGYNLYLKVNGFWKKSQKNIIL